MLLRGSTALGGLLLGGCDRLSEVPSFRRILESAESLSYHSQRLLVGRQALAREFRQSDLSPVVRSNGTTTPEAPEYLELLVAELRQLVLGSDALVMRLL